MTWTITRFRRNGRRWSHSTATYAIDLHRNFARICKKLPVHRLLLGCSRHRIEKSKISFTQVKRQSFKQVKKKRPERFGTSANLSQSCAKTSPQKPCCRCNDKEEDDASTQRPCNYDRLVGADREWTLSANCYGSRHAYCCSQWHWARSVDLYKHSVSAVQSASVVWRWFA